jgi:hypothetical protein
VTHGTANRVGFVLAILLALADIASVFSQTPEGEVGPPLPVLVLGAVLGIVTLIGVLLGWVRGSRAGVRTAAASRILSMLLALPAFFVAGLPPVVRVFASVAVLASILCVVLMLLPQRTAGGDR